MYYNRHEVIVFNQSAVLARWLTHLNIISLYKLLELCETLRSVVYHSVYYNTR